MNLYFSHNITLSVAKISICLNYVLLLWGHNCAVGKSVVCDLKDVEMSHQLTSKSSVTHLQTVDPSTSKGRVERETKRHRQTEGNLTLIFCRSSQIPSDPILVCPLRFLF